MIKFLKIIKKWFFGSIIEKLTFYGNFVSETGSTFPLYRLHRYLAVPRLLGSSFPFNILFDSINKSKDSRSIIINFISKMEKYCNKDLKECRILEIGVGFNPESIKKVSSFGHVTCTDVASYYSSEEERNIVESIRKHNIEFQWDDITKTALPENSFDIICCWDVLEHIQSPNLFFKNISVLLKEGGILYVQYNPFFGINGGHSASITNCYWGHVLFTEEDMERYFLLNSKASVKALDFYNNFLNRLTIYDVHKLVEENSFNIVEICYKRNEYLSKFINHDIKKQLVDNYPTATNDDLLTSSITLILNKNQNNMNQVIL